MNQLIKQEKYYLCLLVSTTMKQQKALLQSIEKSQLRAIVQIVYNVMVGNRPLQQKDKKRLAKRKTVIRQFVSQGLSFRKRKELLLKYFKFILPFINAIQSELIKNGQRTSASSKKSIRALAQTYKGVRSE